MSCSPRRVTIAYEDLENTPTQKEDVSTIKSYFKVRKSINFGNGPKTEKPKTTKKKVSNDMKQDMFFPVENCKFGDLYDFDDTEKQFNDFHIEKVGTGKLVTCNQKKIALFRFGEKVHAIDERCPHMGGPLHLGNIERVGEAKELMVSCPWHKWRVALTSGKLRMPSGRGICNQVYPTQILNNGTIKVGFSEISNEYFSMEYDF